MKKIVFTFALIVSAYPVSAQQPPADDRLMVCRQIEGERTGQVIELAAEVQKLNKQLQEARAELAKAKTPPAKP